MGVTPSNRSLDMAGKEKLLTTRERRGISPFEECFAILGETHDESAYRAIERLVEAGEQVGFTVHDLIRMLNGGMTLESLLDVIEVRMTGTCLHGESGGDTNVRGGVYAHGSLCA
jgi:hypothetical protein